MGLHKPRRIPKKELESNVRRLVLSEAAKDRLKYSAKIFINFPYPLKVPLVGHIPLPPAKIVREIKTWAMLREEQSVLDFFWSQSVSDRTFRIEMSIAEISERTKFPEYFIEHTIKKLKIYRLITTE